MTVCLRGKSRCRVFVQNASAPVFDPVAVKRFPNAGAMWLNAGGVWLNADAMWLNASGLWLHSDG